MISDNNYNASIDNKRTAEMVIGLMAVFNEEDILQQTLSYYTEIGINILIIDNGSTDNSLDIAKSFLGKGVLGIKEIPTDTYRWEFLLDSLLKWSEEFDPDWCLLIDADTFLESPWHGKTLKEGIRDVAAQGYNVINFDNYEFWPVGEENTAETDVRKRLRYYTWADDRQEKCWKAYKGTRNSRKGGHALDLPDNIQKKIMPENFIMRHYRIRSFDQGLRKVFTDRIPRFKGEPLHFHKHYDNFERRREYFEIPKNRLIERVEGMPWKRELVFDGWFNYSRERKEW